MMKFSPLVAVVACVVLSLSGGGVARADDTVYEIKFGTLAPDGTLAANVFQRAWSAWPCGRRAGRAGGG